MAPPSAADFSTLTSAISALNTTMAASGRPAAEATTATNNNTASMKSLASTMASFGQKLEKLGSSLNKTQNDFGVSLASAAKLQVTALADTVKGFVNLFKSIDFSQLLSEVGEVGSEMANMVANVAKDAVSGKGPGNALKEGMSKIGEVLTKERAGPEIKPVATMKDRIEATKQVQNEFGVINREFGNQIAEEAKTRGLNVEQLVQARRIFATTAMGDLSKVAGIQSRFFDQFEAKGMTPKIALEAITKYAELIARNGNRFADSFARAAADAKKIGIDLNKVSQFGDSVISDFEGFLEKTAELGAMGFNLDGSRLAEISETGSDADLFNELRSQLAASGKDITNLRRSERLALEGMFGMTISEMQRLGGDTPQVTSMEDYAEEGNSLLGKILVLLLAAGPIASVLSSGLGATGAIASKLMDLIKVFGPSGVLAAVITALAVFLRVKGNAEAEQVVADTRQLLAHQGGKLTPEQRTALETRAGDAQGKRMGGPTAAVGAIAGGLLGQAFGVPFPIGMAVGGALGLGMGSALGNMQSGGIIAGLEREYTDQSATFDSVSRQRTLSAKRQEAGAPEASFMEQLRTNSSQQTRTHMGDSLGGTYQVAPDKLNKDAIDYMKSRGMIPGTPPIQKAAGGLVTGPGTGKSDSISARLSNGEFVINADMVKKLGLSFLNKLNSGVKVPAISTGIAKAQELKAGGMGNLFSMAQDKLGNMFGGKAGGAVAKAQELKAGGMGNLFSMAQDKLGGMFGGKAGGAMSSISKLFTGGGSPMAGMMGLASKIPGVGGLLGKATGLLSGGGLEGMAGSLLGKVGLGSIGGSLLGGPMGMLGSLAAPLLKKIPVIGGTLATIAGGPGKLMGKLAGSAIGKIGGLFGKNKASVANMLPPQMQAMLSGGQPGMEGVNLPAMLAQMMGSQQPSQAPAAPISVDTRGIEQKLNNFITALQGIQINMDGAQVGKVLVNFSDVAGTTGILRPRTSATF